MPNNKPHPKAIERYEQYFSPQDGKYYEINWKALVHSCKTVGSQKFALECIELVPGSTTINERNIAEKSHHKVSLSTFNARHPREQLDLRCNNHGFTFGNGLVSLNNAQIPLILTDEYVQVHADEALVKGNFDIVCFKEPLAGEWIHSAKFRHGYFMQKRGLQQYAQYASVKDIASISDYQDTIPYYYRRKEDLVSEPWQEIVVEQTVELMV